MALAYEALFRVPVAAIFTGMRSTVARDIEENVATLETRLRGQSGSGRSVRGVAQQLQWLESRKG
jgi:hypothetical protein